MATIGRRAQFTGVLNHLIAVAGTTLTLLLLVQLGPIIGGDPILLAFAIPILLASFAGGFWPGLTATILSALCASYFLLSPLHTFRIDTPQQRIDELVLLIAGLAISALNGKRIGYRHAALVAEKNFDEWFELIPMNVFRLNDRNQFLDANENVCKLTGYTREELLRMAPGEIPFTQDIPRLDSVLGRSDSATDRRWRFRKKDGNFIIVNSSSFDLPDRTRVSLLTDITHLVETEEALFKSERTFRTMANSVPLLAWMAEPDGSIFWYNARWYEYTGKIEEEMLGWGWTSVHHPDRLAEVSARWQYAIEQRQPFEMDFPLRGTTGTTGIFSPG